MYSQAYQELTESIFYSDKYSDDEFTYRHVVLPKALLKLIPPKLFQNDTHGVLKIMTEEEWRSIGIMQSLGWEHYEVHAPEPWVLLFRRPVEEPQPPPRRLEFIEAVSSEDDGRLEE